VISRISLLLGFRNSADFSGKNSGFLSVRYGMLFAIYIIYTKINLLKNQGMLSRCSLCIKRTILSLCTYVRSVLESISVDESKFRMS
jgi:hypothetical protein